MIFPGDIPQQTPVWIETLSQYLFDLVVFVARIKDDINTH